MRRSILVLALFAALIVAIHQGCTPEPEQVRLVPNQPPDTEITGAPLDSSNAFHRYHVFWSGFDSDGVIAEYFVAVTDSNMTPSLGDYRRTLRTDSIIEFTANNEVVLSHAFWVFAVDNEGDRDETPARVFFNAVDTHRPVPVITRATKSVAGDPDTVLAFQDTIPSSGAQVTIYWSASDADVGGKITGYRIKLNTQDQFSTIPADSTSATFTGLPSGEYQFLVEAIDNAGAESLDPATWRWSVNREPDTRVTQMFVWNRSGFFEIPDFRTSPPVIRDSSRVLLFYQGNDRDGQVIDYGFRTVRCDIVRGSCRSLPFGSFFPETFVSTPRPPGGSSDTSSVFFSSNDYFLVVRSRDNEGKADGTPDTVAFHVNFTPVLDAAGVFPGDGDTLLAGPDSLDIRFRADDVESAATNLLYRVVLDGVFGSGVGPVPEESDLVQRWEFPEVGKHEILYMVEDPGRRQNTLRITFHVVAR